MSIITANPDDSGIGYASNNFGDVAGKGAITSRTILIGVRKSDDVVDVLGGLTDGSIQINKTIIPIQELGSDETVLVGGRTSPFRMNVTKSYVNGSNILMSLMTEAELKTFKANRAQKLTPMFVTNIATKELKKPRDFILLMKADGSSTGKFICEAKNVMIESYTFSISAQNDIIFESLSLIGTMFKKAKAKA